MLVRPRFSDSFALVGILLLIVATPAYVAQDETGRDLADGWDGRLPKPRDGMRMEVDMVATWRGEDPVVVGPVRTYSVRATQPGEVPVASVFVYEEIAHPLNVSLGWGVYRTGGTVERVYYDADGDAVWRHVERVERDDEERFQVTVENRILSSQSTLNQWAETPVYYHPSPERVLFAGVARNAPREIVDEVLGRETQETAPLSQVARYNDHLVFALDKTFHPWDGESGPCTGCQSHPEEITPLSLDGPAPANHSRMDGYLWFSPEWPAPVGPRVWYFDAESLEVFLDVDFVPRTLDSGTGRSFDVRWADLWSNKHASAAPATDRVLPQIRLGALEGDPRVVAEGVRIPDLHGALLSDEAPAAVRDFAAGAHIVEFHWTLEATETASAPPLSGLPFLAVAPFEDLGLETRRSTWFLTLAEPTGQTLIVQVAVEATIQGTQVQEVRPICGDKHWALTQARCGMMPPDLVDVERGVADPWSLMELAAEEVHQTGDGLDAFAYLPLYHMTNDALGRTRIATADWAQFPVDARFLGHAFAEVDSLAGLAYWRSNATDAVGTGTLDLRDGSPFTMQLKAPAADFPPRDDRPSSSGSGVVLLDVAGRTAITGGLLLVGLSLVLRLGAWVKAGGAFVAFGLFYAKIAKPQVLDHGRREDIIEVVRADPGATATELAKRLGSGWGATLHHLETLVRNGFLVTVMFGGRRHYFTAETATREARHTIAVRRDDAAGPFMDAVAARPGCTLKELGDLLGRRSSGLSRTGTRLVKEGLVVKRRDGMSVRFWPVAGAGGDPGETSPSVPGRVPA